MNILQEADKIVNQRSEEKDRQYGPFNESMDRMRDIFNAMTGLQLTTEHMFDAMIALKLSRAGYAYKEDTYLDLVGYVGAKNNYIQNKNLCENTCAHELHRDGKFMRCKNPGCDYIDYPMTAYSHED